MQKINPTSFLKTIIALFCVLSILSGCKSQEDISSKTDSSTVSLPEIQSSDIVTDVSSESSAQTDSSQNSPSQKETPDKNYSSVITNTALGSSADPQTPNKNNISGATVNSQELTAKTGKANGIDVSKWQGKIDWQAVKASGIDFAIIRIGYRAGNGTIYKDPNADYNIQQADKAGLLIGVYFFSTAIDENEAAQEARWTANAIKSYPISYPVVYDCEGFTDANSRMASLTKTQRTNNALAFLSQIQSYGYEGMFYGAKSQLENSTAWETQRIAQSYKIWVAHYSPVTYPKKETPDYNGKFDMWQYTNMGKVNGIKGNADLVVSYFTRPKASPKSNTAPDKADTPVEYDPIYTTVNEKVTAKELVNLRSEANQSAKIMGTLQNGEVLIRTAVGSNGWSKLTYNNKTVFAISSYLTTDLKYKPDTIDGFSVVEEKVTAKDVVNLRTDASTDSKVAGSLKNGEVATRIGINSQTGWSKLEYKGKTVYAVTSFLTTDLDYKAPQVSEPVKTDGFTAVNQKVTAKTETNLRSEPSSKDDSTIVYKLKNGEFVNRIGVNNDTGWSKLEYNGQTVYAITSYLTEQSDTNEN